MGTPKLPINVDETTGVWSTDGLPMIYVPQHFFVNNHKAVEEALGEKKYRDILGKWLTPCTVTLPKTATALINWKHPSHHQRLLPLR